MSEHSLKWVEFIIGKEDGRRIEVLVARGNEDSEWVDEEEEPLHSAYIRLYDEEDIIVHTPIEKEYAVLLYSKRFKNLAKSYLNGEASADDILGFLRIDIPRLEEFSKIVFPRVGDLVVLDKSLLRVFSEAMIAVYGGEETLYMLEKVGTTRYLEYFPGKPPVVLEVVRNVVEEDVYDLTGVIYGYPAPILNTNQKFDEVDAIPVYSSYRPQALLLYTAFKRGREEDVVKMIKEIGEETPIPDEPSTWEAEYLYQLVKDMRSHGVGDWKTLLASLAFALIFDAGLADMYSFLTGKYRGGEEDTY